MVARSVLAYAGARWRAPASPLLGVVANGFKSGRLGGYGCGYSYDYAAAGAGARQPARMLADL